MLPTLVRQKDKRALRHPQVIQPPCLNERDTTDLCVSNTRETITSQIFRFLKVYRLDKLLQGTMVAVPMEAGRPHLLSSRKDSQAVVAV